MRPAIARLLRQMPIGLGQVSRIDHAIIAFGCLERFPITAQHLAQSLWRIDRSIDQNMRCVNALRAKFGIERLAQHPPSCHRRCMAVLASIAAHRRCCRGDQQSAAAAIVRAAIFTALHHGGEHRMSKAKEAIATQPPAKFKGAMGRIMQSAIADLCAQIVNGCVNRANVCLDPRHQFFNRAIF